MLLFPSFLFTPFITLIFFSPSPSLQFYLPSCIDKRPVNKQLITYLLLVSGELDHLPEMASKTYEALKNRIRV
jgi:hypothetical protein